MPIIFDTYRRMSVAHYFFLIFNNKTMKRLLGFITTITLSQTMGTLVKMSPNSDWSETIPQNIELGELIRFPSPPQSQKKQIHFYLDGKKMTFVSSENEFIGTVSIYRKGLSLLEGYWKTEGSNWVWFQKSISVKKTPLHQASRLRIPASTWKKMNHWQRQMADRQKVEQIWKRKESEPQSFCFSHPLQSLEVSSFASPRTLPNGHSYYHTGVDLRAPIGTEIKSIGDGRVVLADHQLVPGRVVIIDHGAGVFSRYMHLSEIDVHVGEKVSKQQILGKAGATGRVEGPHLHWEIIWKGRPLNPKKFVTEQRCPTQQNIAHSNY